MTVQEFKALPQHTLYRLHQWLCTTDACSRTLPQHTLYRLHRSKTISTIRLSTLPQHTLYRLHLKRATEAFRLPHFASAHSIQVASGEARDAKPDFDFASAHSIQVASGTGADAASSRKLCLSTLYTGCIDYISQEAYRIATFASAHSIQVASRLRWCQCWKIPSLPQHTLYRLHRFHPAEKGYSSALCLSTLYTGCISS